MAKQSDYRKLTPAQLNRLGYSPTSERYIRSGDTLAKKNTVSRRFYDNLSTKYKAWGGRHKFERRYDIASYRFFVEKDAESMGLGPRQWRKIADDPRNSDNIAAFKAAMAKKRGGRAARNPNGPLGKFLVRINLRQADWTFDVGDTPPS